MDLYRVFAVLQRRKLLFLLCFVLALASAIFIPREGKTQTYISNAKVLLTPPSAADYGGGGGGAPRWWFADEATLRELVASEHLLIKVIERLKLNEDWATLKKNVELAPVQLGGGRYGAVSVFEITVQSDSSQKSKDIADALIDEFVKYIQELSAQEFANTRRFLEELVAEAREKVDQTENKLLTITASRNIGTDEKDLNTAESELQNERLKAREKLATTEAELGAIQNFVSGRSNTPPWSILQQNGAMLKNLEQAVSENRLKLLELNEIYAPESQHVKDQESKLAKVQNLYVSHMNAASLSLIEEKNAESQALKAQLERINNQVSDLRKRKLTAAERRKVTQLERQLNVWDENHLNLTKQLYQARVVEQSSRRQGAISILQKPGPGVVPRDKDLPSALKTLGFGLPFSILFSFAIVILVDYLTSSMQLLPRIQGSLGLPILVVIPILPKDLTADWEKIKKGSKASLNKSDSQGEQPKGEW